MKRIAFRLLAVALSFAVVSAALVCGAAQDNVFEKEIRYSYDGVEYICVASAVRNEQAEEGEEFLLTFAFGSVADPITAKLTEACYSLDNAQTGLEHVYRQEIWNVFAKFGLELYRFVYGKDMAGRTLGGAARELQMHYWMFRFGASLKRVVTPLEAIMGQIQPFAKMVKLLNSLYRRAAVTELGPTDGSDVNGYVFEQANSDLQCLLIYGRDFLSLDFMDGLIDYTNRMNPEMRTRLDQLLFHPNDWQIRAERQAVKKL